MCLDESNPRCSVTVTIQNQNKELKEQLQDDEGSKSRKRKKILSAGYRASCDNIRAVYPSLNIPHAYTAPAPIKSRKVSFS